MSETNKLCETCQDTGINPQPYETDEGTFNALCHRCRAWEKEPEKWKVVGREGGDGSTVKWTVARGEETIVFSTYLGCTNTGSAILPVTSATTEPIAGDSLTCELLAEVVCEHCHEMAVARVLSGLNAAASLLRGLEG